MSTRFEAVITDETMHRFAELSGDVNPGMYPPGHRAVLHGLDIELKAPAYVGDRLTISREITHHTEAYRHMDIKASTGGYGF